MVKKEDFDFISEDEIEKAMRNIIGDKGIEYDHSKVKKKNYTGDPENTTNENHTKKEKIAEKPKNKKMHLSSKTEIDIKLEFEKEARAIVTDPKLSTEEKIKTLNNKLKKRYFRLLDKVKKLTSEEMKIKEKVINTFINSERDILLLENAEKLEPKTVYKDMLKFSREISYIYEEDHILADEDLVLVKDFANLILKEISPNQNEALRILGLTDYIDDDLNFLVGHSINVTIMSMITAIEISKIMKERLEQRADEISMNDAHNFSRKIFNEDEIVYLGMAGLLHDISLRKYFGGLKRNRNYPSVDKIKYQRHPYESYYTILNVKHGLPSQVLIAIENHHENVAETGFPKQMNRRFLDKYQRILSFVTRYEEMAYGSPFHKHYGPSLALNYLMRKERALWDSDIMLAFLKATSLYPVGSYLELDTNEIGIVHLVNKTHIKRPIIKILIDSNNNVLEKERFIDLSINTLINIKQIIHPHHVKEVFKRHKQENYDKHFGLEKGFLDKMGRKLRE